MKKLIIGTAIAIAASSASALDLNVSMTRDMTAERNGVGLMVGNKVGPVHVGLGVDRFVKGNNDLDRYSLVASYDVLKTKVGTLSAKGGGAYLDRQTGKDGFAALAGVGYTLPLTKTLALDVDVVRQFGQDRVKSLDGNVVSAGLTLKF